MTDFKSHIPALVIFCPFVLFFVLFFPIPGVAEHRANVTKPSVPAGKEIFIIYIH